MATLAASTPSRKPIAYHVQLHGLAGILTKPADAVLFLEHASGAVVTVTQADTPHLVVLGAVDSSMQQYLTDMATGRAALVCRRRQEVR
jgi:hypothetical protein